MSEKQAGGLSLRIGLTLNQLQSDFLAAEQTVKQGISALNRQQNLVKLRMLADTAGLDAAIDKTKILEIQEKSLTQLIAMQKDRLTLATKAYQEYANSKNANEIATKKLETGMERERLALSRLESQLKSLSTQKITIDTTQFQEKMSQLNGKIQNVRLKAEIDTSQLQGANAAFDAQKIHIAAVTQELELQRQKLLQLRESMYKAAKNNGVDSVQTLNIKSNVLQQIQEITRLESKLKELQSTDVNLKIKIESFKKAEQEFKDNLAKLNAKVQHVKIAAEIDMSKLKGASAIFEEQKVQVAALTKELELQRQKLIQLREAMYKSAGQTGAESIQTLTIKSNVLEQIREINQLETRLKAIQNKRIDLQFRTESLKQVEFEINQKIERLNAKITHVKVNTEIDMSKFGAMASEFDKAKAQIHGLNRELELQNQKFVEMKRILSLSEKSNGLNNVKTINLQTDIQKQIQAIDQLKAKIAELKKIEPPKTNSLLGSYLNIKGDVASKLNEITSAFSGLKNATSSADNAITSSLSVIGTIPHPVGQAVASLASLPIVFKGIENSIVDMTKAAAASGDAVYVMSRGFQMSVADSAKFATNAKVAGADVMDLANSVKRVQQQIVRGGDNSKAAEMLKRYGESAYSASGGLKDLNEMTFALNRAMKRAQADGKGMEFVLSVFRNISADAITAIEDIDAVNEQASKIVKNGLANPKLAHEVQGNINAMNVQAGQMNAAFESALLPVANEIIPRMTERMGKMTTLIKENKDVILDLGRDMAQVWGGVENAVDKAAEGFSGLAELARENRVVRQTDTKTVVERYKEDPNVKTAGDIFVREQMAGSYTAEDMDKLLTRDDLRKKELRRAEEEMKELQKARREEFSEKYKSILEKYKSDKDIKTMTDLLNRLTEAEKELISQDPSPFFKSLQEKVGVLNLGLQELNDEAKTTKGAIKEFKSVAEDLSTAGQERLNLDGKIEELQQLRKYYENAQTIIDKINLSDYQNKKNSLQKWLQEQLPRDAEQSLEKYHAVMKEYKARDLQIERERADKLKEIRDGIAAADKSALENKLDSIEKEKQAWIKAGMEEAEATELAEKKKSKARQESAEKAQEYIRNAADIEYEMTHTAFEKQLRDIEQWKEAKIKAGEDASAVIAEAAAKEAQAFEREIERIKSLTQSLEDEIFEMEHSQYETDKRRAMQKAQKALAEGADNATVQRWLNEKFGILSQKAAESQKNNSDYTKSPKGGNDFGLTGYIIDYNLPKKQQQQLSLLSDESKIRANLLPKLSASARAEVEKIQSAKALTSAQEKLIDQTMNLASQPTFQGTPIGSSTIIQGDQVTQISAEDVKKILEEQKKSQQILTGEIPIRELEQFGVAVQDTAIDLKKFQELNEEAQKYASSQQVLAEMAKDLPPEYFKNLADGAKAVSEMQSLLTKSTLELMKAQGNLTDELKKISNVNPSRELKTAEEPKRELKLSAPTQKIIQEQERLADTAKDASNRLREISDIPPQSKIAPKDEGLQLGFNWEAFSGIAQTGLQALSFLSALGGIAPHPAVKAGSIILGGALGAGVGFGTWDKMENSRKQYDDRLKPMSENVDLSELKSPLISIDEKTQSILQEIESNQSREKEKVQEMLRTFFIIDEDVKSMLQERQMPKEISKSQTKIEPLESAKGVMSEYAKELSGINTTTQSILQELQAKQTFSLETVVTPLNTLNGTVSNILTALNNRKPPQVTVSPNNNINLGGAYVFDNAMKQELVNDITSRIVSEITTAVRGATNKSSYGYGA